MTIVNHYITDPVLMKENREFCERVMQVANDASHTQPPFDDFFAQLQAIPIPFGYDEVQIDTEMAREILRVPLAYIRPSAHQIKMPGLATVTLTVKAVNKRTGACVIAPSLHYVDPWWLNKASATATGATVPTPVPTKAPPREKVIEGRILTIMEATAIRNAALQMPVPYTLNEMRNLLQPQTASDYVPNSAVFRKAAVQPATGSPLFEFSIDFTDQLTGAVKVLYHVTGDSWWESEFLRLNNATGVTTTLPKRGEGAALRAMQKTIADAANRRVSVTVAKTEIERDMVNWLSNGYLVTNVRWHHRNHPTYGYHGLGLGFSDSAFVVEGTDPTGSPFILGCKAPQAWWEAENICVSGIIPTSADFRAVMTQVRDECDTQGKSINETCSVMQTYLNHAASLYAAGMTVNGVTLTNVGTPGNPDYAFLAALSTSLHGSGTPFIYVSIDANGGWWTWCAQQMLGTPAPQGTSPWFAPAGLTKGLLNSAKAVMPAKDLAPKEPLFNVSVMRQIVTDEMEQCALDGEDRANTRLRVQQALKPFLTSKHSVEWVSIDRDAANPKMFNMRVGILDHTNAAEDESGEGVMISVTLPIPQPWWN